MVQLKRSVIAACLTDEEATFLRAHLCSDGTDTPGGPPEPRRATLMRVAADAQRLALTGAQQGVFRWRFRRVKICGSIETAICDDVMMLIAQFSLGSR